MMNPPVPVFRNSEEILLVGTMAVYGSQAEASRRIPEQWRRFLRERGALAKGAEFYGASPCTGDHKIHYMTGAVRAGDDAGWDGESLVLAAGEYAVVSVEDPASLRETWGWLLGVWLRGSGRRERDAPEFERFTGLKEDGTPIGPVEIWIPLAPAAED